MADIGGLSIQKALLKELVLYPLQNSTIDSKKKLQSIKIE